MSDTRIIANTSPAGSLAPVASAPPLPPPRVPDHELIRPIGRGAYGEVWLARCATGAYRAVKIVHRQSFDHDRPFEREFEGILKFEPVSRTHDSQVDILHVGRGDDCFYYVMELADDQATGGQINPDHYTPRTLKSDLQFQGRLPFEECVRIGIALATALEHLHENGLVHRDVKPSNIIFVNGVPKLADIGLVTGVDATRSFVGTEGFAAPEGAGTPEADLYSLGKVLYEAATGKDRQEFPELPTQLRELPDREGLMELNAVIARACRHDPEDRYHSAAAMRADLELLQSGKSLARLHRTEKQLRFVQRAGAVVTAIAALIAAGWWWEARQTRAVRMLAAQNLKLAKRADANASLAQKNEIAARERLYAADVHLAQQALNSDNLRLARDLLQSHIPRPGQPDLRGFEWRYLWEKCRSEELFSLPAQTNTARVFAISPDDQRVAIGGYDGPTRLLDVVSRRAVGVLPGTNPVFSVSFSPRNDLLVTATERTVRLCNPRTLTDVRLLPDAAAPAVFSPDGRWLLTGKAQMSAADKEPSELAHELILWDAATWIVSGSATIPASGKYSWARDLYVQPVFGQDGKRLVVLAGDKIRLLSVPDLKETRVLAATLPTSSISRPFIALSPDNRTLATSSPKGFGIQLWDIKENRELRTLTGHTDTPVAAAFSPGGFELASCSPDQTVRLWNVATGSLLNSFRGQADEVLDLAFSSDGKLLASLGGYDVVVKFWDPNTRPRRDSFRESLAPVGFDLDGSLIAFKKGLPIELDPASLQISPAHDLEFRDETGYFPYPNSVSQDGRLQAIWGGEKKVAASDFVEVWDRRQANRLCTVSSATPLVSFAPKRQLISTYVLDLNSPNQAYLTVWQLPSGSRKWAFTNEVRYCGYRPISPDEQYILTGNDERLRLWKIDGDKVKPVLELPGFYGRGEFSPDGHLLATAFSGDIEIRELPSARVVGALKGHTRKGVEFAFSPDSRTLASMADDRTVRLWHIATQRELLLFQTPDQDRGFRSLEFSPDGRALAVRRVDDQGPINWLYYAPSLAEIALTEGGDYRKEAADNPQTWLNVAQTFQRRNRPEESLQAFNEVLDRTTNREGLAWLHRKALRQRVAVLRGLGRLDEAGADNCAILGIPSRNPATPAGAIDLSAFYNLNLSGGDFGDLPLGTQTFADTVFDVRGKLHIMGPSPEHGWATDPARIDGIRVQRKVGRLHFLQAAEYVGKDIPTGERIGHFKVHFANGQAQEIPLLYNQNTSDWRELKRPPRDLPDAAVAWRSANAPSGANSKPVRLFKLSWPNPTPEVEITSIDFAADHQEIQPFVIALTAE